jgi:hypothetical protein
MVTPVTVAEAVDIFAVSMLVLHTVGLSFKHWKQTLEDRYEGRFDATIDAYVCGDNLRTHISYKRQPCHTLQQVSVMLDATQAMPILVDTLQRNIADYDMASVLVLLLDWVQFVDSSAVQAQLM